MIDKRWHCSIKVCQWRQKKIKVVSTASMMDCNNSTRTMWDKIIQALNDQRKRNMTDGIVGCDINNSIVNNQKYFDKNIF